MSADDQYLEHFGFSHDPFAARTPGFKFYPAQRKPVLGQLHHLARYSQLLLAVTGPSGSGKTLLRQALVASTNKQSVRTVVISAQAGASSESILQQVAQGLDAGGSSMATVLAQVVQLGLTGQEVYILIDDADRLAESGLDAALRLAEGSPDGRPHVFLFGQPSLASRLEALAGNEERFHAIELQPYTLEESRNYLAARLEGAGHGIELFSEEQIEDIHDQAEGWPGRINAAAKSVLIEKAEAERSQGRKGSASGFALPRKHLAAAAAVLLVVALAWLFSTNEPEEPAESAEVPLSLDEAAVPGADPASALELASGAPIEFEGGDQPIPLPLVGDAQPVIREPLAASAGGEDEAQQPLDGGSASSIEPIAPMAVPPRAEPPPRQEIAVSEPKAAPVEPAPEPAREERATPKPAPASSGTVSAAGWYAERPASRFVVQLLGTRTERNAQALVDKHGGQFRYYTKQHEGKPLYVVTYGDFTSRAAAQAAIAELPQALRSGKPWVRTVGDIQREMTGAR
ncbi:AAA family ATPase [Stutzerimonas urumqiensis]